MDSPVTGGASLQRAEHTDDASTTKVDDIVGVCRAPQQVGGNVCFSPATLDISPCVFRVDDDKQGEISLFDVF